MDINRLLALTGLLALAISSAFAQGKGGNHGWYAALDYGQSQLETDYLSINSVEEDDSSKAYAVRVGYRFTRHFAFDVGYSDLGDFTAHFVDYDSRQSIFGYQVNATWTWPVVDHFHLEGAVRGFHRRLESSVSHAAGTDRWHETSTVVGLAIGIAIPINQRFEVELDYTDYRDLWTGTASGYSLPHYDAESSLIALGLRFNF